MLEISSISILAAFAAGAVSFLSPCCLPLVPGYLSTVSSSDRGNTAGPQVAVSRMLLFLSGFSFVFIALGMSASALGRFLQINRPLLSLAAGTIVVAMGMLLLRPQGMSFSWLSRSTGRLSNKISTAGPLLVGSAFAIAWTPCIGPILAAVLTVAATTQSVGSGGLLLASYSLGLAVPFFAVGLAYNRFFARLKATARYRRIINALGAVILIAMGLLLASDKLFIVNITLQRAAAAVGLDLWRYL